MLIKCAFVVLVTNNFDIYRNARYYDSKNELMSFVTFICGLPNVAVIISDCIATHDGMMQDLESTVFGTNRSCPNLR
jgi:hypothetical protein